MIGRHRGSSQRGSGGAVVAVIAAVAVVLALVCYLLILATSLERLSAVWVVFAVLTVDAFVRDKGSTWLRWTVPGSLIATTMSILDAVARRHDWPHQYLHTINLGESVVDWIGITVIGLLGLQRLRIRSLARRQPPAL